MAAYLDKQLILITGKGGVGRTTVAAALAQSAASTGKRVLLAEISNESADYSPLARLFGLEQLPLKVERLKDSKISGVQLQPLVGMERFVYSVVKMAPLAKAAVSTSALVHLMNAAPSFREMGLFYHLLTLLKERRNDGSLAHELLVVDMPATGHTLALTGLPAKLQKIFPRGPVRSALSEGYALIYNPQVTGAYPVALPESLVVTETLELIEQLGNHEFPIGGVFLNKVLQNPFSPTETASLAEFHQSRPLLGAQMAAQMGNSDRSISRLKASTQHQILPLPYSDAHGHSLLDALAEHLSPQAQAVTV